MRTGLFDHCCSPALVAVPATGLAGTNAHVPNPDVPDLSADLQNNFKGPLQIFYVSIVIVHHRPKELIDRFVAEYPHLIQVKCGELLFDSDCQAD
jgi:hypothetical protein